LASFVPTRSFAVGGHSWTRTRRIIFSGALLRDDDAVIRDVLGSADVTAQQVFHLVTSQSNASTPAGTPSASVARA
jgi:hypothetical protein